MLAKMAKADGKVDAWETHAAEGAFARFPRAAARRKFCVRVFNESKRIRISLYRQAWEDAAKKCHPDILRASGASEGRIAAATEQMARINDAWDTIREARGM